MISLLVHAGAAIALLVGVYDWAKKHGKLTAITAEIAKVEAIAVPEVKALAAAIKAHL